MIAKMSLSLLSLPEEIISNIESFLCFEDSTSLSQTCRRLHNSCAAELNMYDKMQISDDVKECRVSDSRHRRSPLSFHPSNAAKVLSKTSGIAEISVLMKEVELTKILRGNGRSPYTPGGYLGPLLFRNLHALQSLKQLSLHVDIMVETIKDHRVPCPVEDLSFALQYLFNAPFQTFIQISACCAEYTETDVGSRNLLISGMQQALKTAAQLGADTDFVVEPNEGYVDMTVEKQNLEYSFAFFYYNPSICEAAVPEEPMDVVSPCVN